MRTSRWMPSVVADNAEQTVYLVVDDFDHQGRVIREGPMEDVQRDPQVIEVYLGRSALREAVS